MKQVTKTPTTPGEILAASTLLCSHVYFLFTFCLFYFIFLRQTPALSPRLECSGTITDVCHHTRLIFVFFVKMGFCHVAQASLQLLGSSNPPTLASQSGRITGVSYGIGPPFTRIFSVYIISLQISNNSKSLSLQSLTLRLVVQRLFHKEH